MYAPSFLRSRPRNCTYHLHSHPLARTLSHGQISFLCVWERYPLDWQLLALLKLGGTRDGRKGVLLLKRREVRRRGWIISQLLHYLSLIFVSRHFNFSTKTNPMAWSSQFSLILPHVCIPQSSKWNIDSHSSKILYFLYLCGISAYNSKYS